MALSGVPVKMFDQVIGSAHVHDDGTFDLNIDSPFPQGQEVLKSMERGEYSGLYIMPTPAAPRMETE